MRCFAMVVLVSLVAAGCPGSERPEVENGEGGVRYVDTDGDGISDSHEGRLRSGGTDTDGDGTADFRDFDSDDDGIPDATEAGNSHPTESPRDADGDGTADFRDEDADGNGIFDRDERTADTDGDGTADFADLDDDGDFAGDAAELEAVAGNPAADFDGDGHPNFRDPDADEDNILDGEDGQDDTDDDGRLNWVDRDSDADGLRDIGEAGDGDLHTPPVDTDGDRIPDFRDADSDGDGIPDEKEQDDGTSASDADSDGDGASDLIETAAGTDGTDPEDNPKARGDFVFVVPYGGAPRPERDTLEFRTNIQFADVYFLMDTTGSMTEEISSMHDAVVDIIDNITCEDYGVHCRGDADCRAGRLCGPSGTCIEDPTESACVASVWTGTGVYWGDPGSYTNQMSLQSDPTVTRAEIPRVASGRGSGEALFESTACVADPALCMATGCTTSGRIGCPGFRPEAIRILVTITDEPDECTECIVPPPVAGARLKDAGITFVGVDADDDSSPHDPRADLETLATASDSLDRSGEPLVFEGDARYVTDAVTTAINEIVEDVPLHVTIETANLPDDDGNALPFIDQIGINTSGARCGAVSPRTDEDGDGVPDTFPELVPGTPVCWDIVARRNERVSPTRSPQVFKAELTVTGDGSPLDSRTVYFLVPPRVPPPEGPH